MARKKATAANGGGEEAEEKGRRAISQRDLRALIAHGRRTKNEIDEIAGGFGSAVAKAVESKYLNRRVFGIIRRLDRMEPAKLRDEIDDLMHYLDISGLNERAAQAPRLPIEEGEDDNVTEFPAPRGEAAE